MAINIKELLDKKENCSLEVAYHIYKSHGLATILEGGQVKQIVYETP